MEATHILISTLENTRLLEHVKCEINKQKTTHLGPHLLYLLKCAVDTKDNLWIA